MGNYTEVYGDLIQLAKKGKFDVIAHGCNCGGIMGSGIALQMARTFHCDRFEMEMWGTTIEKLGNIDCETFVLGENAMWSLNNFDNHKNEPELTVVNVYTQMNIHTNAIPNPLDYEAVTLCMRKMNKLFKGKRIGLPRIGAGLARGDWDKVKTIIQHELADCDVTVVIYKK